MKRLLFSLLLACVASVGFAQRFTDKMDRGLVAVPSGSGNFVSWHVFGEEYYDVTYNLYRDGAKIASNLEKSNYLDNKGTSASKYQVAPVVRGVEGELCKEVTRWDAGYLRIPVAAPTDRNGNDVSAHYTLNDVSIGDLTGDGIVEFIVKRKCDAITDLSNKRMFHQLDCYDRFGNRLWWIDLGPNMLAGADEQWDCVCYDWDMDGKAEVLLRIQDNAYIHYPDGSKLLIGDANVDTRWDGIEYTSSGNEYLLYLEGATGKPYQIGPDSHPNYIDYPNTRESDAAWGSGIVGHRSTKHYFGAPFLDGRRASIFLGRGCYTMHKFTALDVDPETHKLTTRWYWETRDGSSPWFGNGYHNFAIGDVDWDGRDEIIFGSMVIDDNGLGLSTTSYGHGDAQHCADLDPYRKYEEQFACLEEGRANFGNNYRNAATGEIYFKFDAGGDDGRALMANFTNDYPGSVGRSVSSGWISSVADKIVPELNGDAFIHWSDLNQRIYWDGDLLDEYFDSPGTEGYGAIYKPASQTTAGGRWNFQESKCNNWSKNNPGGIADILGDWREELIMRQGDNSAILVYTTPIPTEYRIPTLWHDHQYRNAMVWQSMGYNQPPHKSYFLGEMEGITQAPPPYTNSGRKEIANGGTITTTDDHLLVCETNDMNISIADGASPYMVTFNIPSWVQGTAVGNSGTKKTPITYDYYTCTVTGGALTGTTRLVKQGDGILTLPAVNMTYTGETNIWAGTINFFGSAAQSPVWLNRFAILNSNTDYAEFKSIKADYGSELAPGGIDFQGIIKTGEYYMGFGSRLKLDLYSDGLKADFINATKIIIEKKDWQYGPKYLLPVIEITEHMLDGASTLEPGRYLIAHADELEGSLANIKIEGITDLKIGLVREANGDIYLELGSVRGATNIAWTGTKSSIWDYASTENFYVVGDEEQTPDVFVTNDVVNFTDEATSFTVKLAEATELPAGEIFVDNTKDYTIEGTGSISTGKLTKVGSGRLTIKTENTYKDGNYLKGGTVIVSSLANSTQATGNLGAMTNTSAKFTIEDGAVLQTSGTVKNGSPMKMVGELGGVINNSGLFTMEKLITGTKLTKKGSGKFDMQASLNTTSLEVAAGEFAYSAAAYTQQVTLSGTGSLTGSGFLTTPIYVAEGAKAALTTLDRTKSNNTITGTGQITIYGNLTGSGGATRTQIQPNLNNFEGILVPQCVYAADGRFSLDMSGGNNKFTMNIPSGVIVQNSGKLFKMGKVTGDGKLSGTCSFSQSGNSAINTWQAGNDEDFQFNGIVDSNAKFIKVGSGKMTVNGVWTTTGAVTINEGEVHLNATKQLGKGTLTVVAGAALTGLSAMTASSANSNPMTNSAFTINGTIQCGGNATSVTGFWNFGGKNLTLGSTAVLRVGLSKCATATNPGGVTMQNINTLTIDDGATVSVFLAENYTPTTNEEVPDSFRIFSGVTTYNIGELNFDLPELPADNSWDTSHLNEGYLFVRYSKASKVEAIAADEQVAVEVISAAGATVASYTCPMADVKAILRRSSVPSGIYLLRIKSESGNQTTIKTLK